MQGCRGDLRHATFVAERGTQCSQKEANNESRNHYGCHEGTSPGHLLRLTTKKLGNERVRCRSKGGSVTDPCCECIRIRVANGRHVKDGINRH